MAPADNLFWTAPDGTRWRVWLEPAPRHRLRQGDNRSTITFVNMENPRQQEVRLVPGGTKLDQYSDGAFAQILARTTH